MEKKFNYVSRVISYCMLVLSPCLFSTALVAQSAYDVAAAGRYEKRLGALLRDKADFSADPAFNKWFQCQIELIERAISLYKRCDTDKKNRIPLIEDSDEEWDINILLSNLEQVIELRAVSKKTAKQSILNVKSFGAKGDGINNDGPALRAAVEKAREFRGIVNVQLLLPEGTYRISDRDARAMSVLADDMEGIVLPSEIKNTNDISLSRRSHLFIHNMTNMVFLGGGKEPGETRILFTGEPLTSGLTLFGCQNVVVSNISFDFDPLPYSQGTVTRLIDDFSYEFTVDPGFPLPTDPHLFGLNTGFLCTRFATEKNGKYLRSPKTPSWLGVKDVVPLDSRRFRVTTLKGGSPGTPLENHALLNTKVCFHRRTSTYAVLFQNCTCCAAHHVDIYSSPSMGIRTLRSFFTEIGHCRDIPLPHSARIFATCADFSFNQNNRCGTYVHNCTVQNNLDDYCNFLASAHPIYDYQGAEVTLFYGRADGPLYKKDDVIYILSGEQAQIEFRTIIQAVRLDMIDGQYRFILTVKDTVPEKIKSQKLNANAKPHKIFNRSADNFGAVVANNAFLSAMVSRCIFRNAHTVVEDNQILSRSGEGHFIVLGCERSEYGPVRNIIIRNNIIDGLGNIILAPHHYAAAAVNRDVVLTNNVFINPSYTSDADVMDGKYFRTNVFPNLIFSNNKYSSSQIYPALE